MSTHSRPRSSHISIADSEAPPLGLNGLEHKGWSKLAACLRKVGDDQYIAGTVIRSAAGLFRETIDMTKGQIARDGVASWRLDLLRLGTRQTTAVMRLNGHEVVRINGDTTRVEPDTACVGILHRHSGSRITLHVDQLHMTEAL